MEIPITIATLSFYLIGSRLIDWGYLDRFHVSEFTSKCRLRAKAWLITLFSSCVMTIYGICYERPPLQLYMVDWLEDETPQSRFLTKMFCITLLSDLVIGFLEYRSEIDVLSGWVHHIVYIEILRNFLVAEWSNSFTVCLICEFPTLLLAIGNVFPCARLNNGWIRLAFFPTRIVWCLVVGGNFLLGQGWLRQICVIPILLLHTFWYIQLGRQPKLKNETIKENY